MTELTFGQGNQLATATNEMDTPETDKAERMAYAGEYMVPTEVARRLERERDEARTERDILKIVDPAWPLYIQQLERERDEWATMCGRYKQERDEAREQRGPGAAPHRKN